MSNGKIVGYIVAGVAVVGLAAAGLYLVDVDQTKEARLPDVDVSVEEGQMPAFDVDVADVEVGTKKTTVKAPTVDVETKTIEVEVPAGVDVEGKEVEVTLPTIDIDKPEEDDPADNPQ